MGQAKEDIEDTSAALSYECEKKPMKIKSEGLGSLDFMSEIAKGRFAVTANVNKDGKGYSVEAFLHRADGVRDRLPGAGRAQLHPLARQGLPEPGACQHPGLLWSLPWQDCPSQACQL